MVFDPLHKHAGSELMRIRGRAGGVPAKFTRPRISLVAAGGGAGALASLWGRDADCSRSPQLQLDSMKRI
ncbi:hypothetical protein DCC62_30545 [candidate division KSB1 bacterium]|nr:MAG: hypothetical protein DCC62_30545 [candidate division KSB1 bacterium]